ncbi:NYN domain-containing protein [Paraferrimonas sp. SM1919]|uniref:LabA-like NYN domain-containing protein n=1 Tax=Paraferrimonas sp. SM1919 TaxID=2662263 RepID=UPI0013D78CCB|nr:NYN domain-containing protein [Paraferrimonas sp. SM1919]
MTKLAVFADVQNIYYTCKESLGGSFNYRKCWQQLTQYGDITHAYAYAIDKGDDGQIKFQDALRHIGFEVKLKPFISRADGSAKGDWDVGITIDMLDLATKVDEVVLLSGDGDFAILLDKLRSLGVKTRVISAPNLTATSLIKACDHYQEISADLLL